MRRSFFFSMSRWPSCVTLRSGHRSVGKNYPRGCLPRGVGPWSYFLSGCALAIFVGIASSQVKDTDKMPIRELFKNRQNAVLLMCMAVFVAPLVEETVFRGYLYPLLARMAYGITRRFGVQPPEAIRTGMFSSVVITGVLFGLMHGAQLGWTWSVVGLLILVGVIFTFVRARTGTVLASFLLHWL